MRRLVQALTLLSVTPVALALPVVSRPGAAAPRPVAPKVAEHAVGGIDADAARAISGLFAAGPATSRPLAVTRQVRTQPFQALGVTWTAGTGDEVEVVARVRQDGRWTPWHLLDSDSDHGPDDGTVDTAAGVRGGTSPWFHGEADGYQVRVGVVEGKRPRDVRVSLVDPGSSPADASLGRSPVLGGDSAMASVGQPSIITRAQWGADESLRDGEPDYGDTIKMGFVHHTDSSNSYSSAQAPAMVRSVYAFHTQSRGWSDIGYNFIADKFGRVFEGRYGGVDKPVIGAHTGGFNTDTFAVSLLGNYSSAAPTSAQLAALQRMFAWKLGLHYVNPLGKTTMTSRGGSKYPEGQQVTLNNVSGHRDAGLTACPGQQTYNRLPTIRSAIKSYMGASLYYPSVTTTRLTYLATTSVSVKATTPVSQNWRVDVRNARSGSLVRQLTGSATTSINAAWNLRDKAGMLVPPDTYSLTLHSWTSRSTARPYKVRVAINSPLPSGVAITHTAGTPFLFVDNGSLGHVSEAMARAVRPTPALVSYAGQRVKVPYAALGPRDGLYLRSSSTGTAFVIVDGQRRSVTSAVASALGLTAPVTLPSSVFAPAPAGPAWTDTARHPDGMVVRGSDGTAWRLESGVRRPFTSPASRAAWSRGLTVPLATAGDLALPLGAPLAPPEGVVLRTSTGAGVVSGGTFRPLTNPGALGYAVASAPLATTEDLAALVAGPSVGSDRHPSGALLKNGETYYEVQGTSRRLVPPSLLALDPRVPVAPETGEVSALTAARWVPGSGLAGRSLDGVVRVVDNGRLVTLSPAVAKALGYTAAALPALEAADFGPLPAAAALANPAAHPAGSVVTDGTAVWVLDGGVRRPLAASLVATYLGRPALPATAADLALPVAGVAPPATGAWVSTPDGKRWLVDRGVRREVPLAVATRLGLAKVKPLAVVAAELTAATVAGSAVV